MRQIEDNTNKGEEEEEEQQQSPMFYIPDEMAALIMRRLCLEDQIKLRSSCRSWLSLGTGTAKPHLKFPWLLISDKDMSSYFLYNPTTCKSHLFRATFPNICPSHLNYRAQVLAASHGWLLMAFPCCHDKPFLYNPFTRSTLKLPTRAAIPPDLCSRSYAFDYCHVEKHLTVYSAWFQPGLAWVTAWSTGDKVWNMLDAVTLTYDNHGCEWAKISLICVRGVLYCYFSKDKVVVFRRTSNGRFNRIDVQLPPVLIPKYYWIDNVSLYVSKGDLYAVSRYGFTNLSGTCTWHVARLDLAERTWAFEEDTKKAYFYGDKSIPTVVISEPSEAFAGRFISLVGRGFGRCVFSNVPVSHIPNYVSSRIDECVWSFPWPCNVLQHYDRDQLKHLNVLWIETPTL